MSYPYMSPWATNHLFQHLKEASERALMPKKKKRPSNNPNGRPKKSPGEKFVTPNRFLGRVNEADWKELKDAATGENLTFTAWALPILLRAARKKKKTPEDV